MKKLLFSFLFAGLSSGLFAQTVEVSGDITADTEWTNDKIYVLNDLVYVTNGATLTIKPGTVIQGKPDTRGSLIITRGSKINASGTKEQPIVFTSGKAAGERDYGDLGGLVILGKAPVNIPGASPIIEGGLDEVKGAYGGTDPNDNSGVIRYVRIEFAGNAFQPNKEINSLTLGGVGSGTTIEYVQVSYANDDAYEWFGGTVNCKYLVAYRTNDDEFDTDLGYLGNVQFGVALRDPNVSDVSGSNGFESDNDPNGTGNTPVTGANFSNMTVIGALAVGALPADHQHKRALHIRRNTQIGVYNSAFIGYPTGLYLDGSAELAAVENDLFQFRNSVIAGCTKSLDTTKFGATSFDVNTWFNTASYKNSIVADKADLKLPASAYSMTGTPDFRPGTGSPLLAGAEFTNARLSSSFFKKDVSFIGAFGSENWMAGWTEFDPQNKVYAPVTGIDEALNNLMPGLTLYPNPATETAAVRFELKETAKVAVEVVSLNGQTVVSLPAQTLNAGAQNIALNLNGLNNGLYFVKISTPVGVKTLKLNVSK